MTIFNLWDCPLVDKPTSNYVTSSWQTSIIESFLDEKASIRQKIGKCDKFFSGCVRTIFFNLVNEYWAACLPDWHRFISSCLFIFVAQPNLFNFSSKSLTTQQQQQQHRCNSKLVVSCSKQTYIRPLPRSSFRSYNKALSTVFQTYSLSSDRS